MLGSCSVPDGSASAPVPSSPTPTVHEAASDATAATSEEEAEVPEAAPITLSGPGQLLPITATAEMKGEVFELEVAQTQFEQALGLMFRSALPDNRGMLFPFDPPRPTSFWMKDVPVPLDMVFLRHGKVIAIAAEVPPCPSEPCPSYGPSNQLIDNVLELRSGRAAEIDLQPGDTVIIQPLSEAL
ncbi:MAG: DUF192 domain-containing protein [Phormidesmis sp. RL_2_1]|nr:DUF192 domain-containing protein [Phormidesmis sp. RL_2_1]